MPRKEKIYLLSRKERVYSGADEEGICSTVKVTTNYTSVLCREER